MRIGFQLVLYILILNLISGMMYALNVPGTERSNILTGTGNVTEYQERFNPGEFLNATEPEASTTFTFIGHIWNGLNVIWSAIRFTVFGFPTMLQGIGSQIQDPAAAAAFTNIANVLYAIFSFIIMMWLYQLLTGRNVET
jgi:hypothetical protein